MDTLTDRGKVLVGVGAIGITAGVIAYFASRNQSQGASLFLQNVAVTLSPPPQSPYPAGISTATVSWQNPTTQPVQYGIQGDIILSGTVQGHFWTSLAAGSAALAAFQSGGAAALQPYELAPQNRVAVLTVQPGQSGSAVLTTNLTQPVMAGGPETWTFMLMPAYRSGLLVADPLGTLATVISSSAATSRYVLTVPKVG